MQVTWRGERLWATPDEGSNMIATLALALTLGATPAPPRMVGFLDAAQLVQLCQAEGAEQATNRALCLGYVAGVADQIMMRGGQRLAPSVCLSQDLDVDKLGDAVLRRLSHRRDLSGVAAAAAVRGALQAEFPCPASGRL